MLVAGGASAATFTNVPSGATTGLPFAYFGNGANPSGDSPAVGEVILLTSEQMLASFSFYAVGNLSQSLQLNVAQWNPDTNAKNQAVNGIGSVLLTTIGAPTRRPPASSCREPRRPRTCRASVSATLFSARFQAPAGNFHSMETGS